MFVWGCFFEVFHFCIIVSNMHRLSVSVRATLLEILLCAIIKIN